LVAATWTDNNYWSWISGGPGGAGVPDEGDNIIFDHNSPSCTVDVDAMCRTITVSGYSNILDFDVYDFTSYEGAYINSGTINGGSGILTFCYDQVGDVSFVGTIFNAETSRVFLAKVSTFSTGGQAYNVLEVSKNYRYAMTFVGSCSAAKFRLNPGNYIKFHYDHIFEFDLIEWEGAAHPIFLFSTVNGRRWYLRVNQATPVVYNVKVRDCCSIGSVIIAK
jgi:hypothetical protein